MSFMERLSNTISLVRTKIMYSFALHSSTSLARSFYGSDLPNLHELAANTSLILVNSHFSINHVRPTVPGFVEVGGLHIKPSKPVPKHFEDILNTDTSQYKGVVYFSMGSMVLLETLPLDKLTAFFEAFKELPYTILWKSAKQKLPADLVIPENIQFEFWVPQADILCHPNIKLFISHVGLLSLQEAIFCGVPIIGIPLFADQKLNARALETLGVGIIIDYEDITKENILNACTEILYNSRYEENAKIASIRFQDRPKSPLDTAVYWVEYVIRHKGATHLRSSGADMPWYQYHLLDVGLILILGLATLISIIYIILRVVVTFMFKLRASKCKFD